MSDLGDVLEYLFKDKRTKRQKFISNVKFIGIFILILLFIVGIGVLIGKFLL